MIKNIRYYKIPAPLIEELHSNPLTCDLFITEAGEIEVQRGTIWGNELPGDRNLLVCCTKGSGIVQMGAEQIPVTGDQFFIIPKGSKFKFYSVLETNTRFLVAFFDGKKTGALGKEFSLVRNLLPSVNNMVANRELLFDEIFNNLSKGFHDENLEYISFCFGHLLATFVYASRTAEDIENESNPVVQRAISYLEKNLDKKLTLNRLAAEMGYSPTYLSILFKKETNYSPISYFSHLKILKACEYLDYTKIKIKQISFNLGYSDPYYFTRDFTKKMGMPPRQYRNRAGKKLYDIQNGFIVSE